MSEEVSSPSRRLDAQRGVPIEITFNGAVVSCFDGETVATALLADGVTEFGTTRTGAPRQPLCNMGTCFDCVVVVDSVPLTRSCLTYAVDGMNVESSRGA
ncbi:(2Fe-2S)-binding protein [Glaciibacter psychrotolerans]|uniref:Sarcosine oxidase subunit alpha n=1 Tax=Glaciibacter psychrotolerans TaxID=670054 RepID=A0A7Z0EB57_9MICO|nr:(2Fe-2S)-binding protein [Leifsonia psychrotolerans]NYJ18226.1 sarcosine oxidase subunit alpha [Leifsonia psychrotolerans]